MESKEVKLYVVGSRGVNEVSALGINELQELEMEFRSNDDFFVLAYDGRDAAGAHKHHIAHINTKAEDITGPKQFRYKNMDITAIKAVSVTASDIDATNWQPDYQNFDFVGELKRRDSKVLDQLTKMRAGIEIHINELELHLDQLKAERFALDGAIAALEHVLNN